MEHQQPKAKLTGVELQHQVNEVFCKYSESDDHKLFREFRDDHVEKVSSVLRDLTDAGKEGLVCAIELASHLISQKNLNPRLVKLALGIFLTHSDEAQRLGVLVPSLKDRHEFMGIVRDELPLSNPVTADTMKGVEILAYFREDYDFNDHHYHWHHVYPSSGIPEPGSKKNHRVIDRQGELFLYMHSQMVARYNAELLSWGLDMTHAWGYDDVLTFGYTPVPKLRDSFGARPPFQGWYENHNPFITEDPPVSKRTMITWRNNIFNSIEDGFFSTKKSNNEAGQLKLTADNAMNWVGVIVEAESKDCQEVEPGSGEYIDRDLYGSLHNLGHDKFAEIGYHEYTSDKNKLGVMGFNSVSPRDPCFWLWHRHIDDFHQLVVKKYIHSLRDFQPLIEIKELKILPGPQSKTPKGGIATFLGPPQLQLNEANAKLDHEPYHWELTVASTRYPPATPSNKQTFTVRLFIAPKALIQDQRAWIEMDKFTHTLSSVEDTITREDTQSSVARKTPKPGENLSARCLCGWPQNLMLPIGTPEGIPYVAFAMLTNDELTEDGKRALSFCGAKDDKYPDPRGMGYPFDKTWASRVDSTATVQQIIDGLPHMKLYEFTIYRYTKLYQGGDVTPPTPSDITWEHNIKSFFTPRDIKCMKEKIDLSNKESVKINAGAIYQQVESGDMPKNEAKWSKQKVADFKTWMDAGCP